MSAYWIKFRKSLLRDGRVIEVARRSNAARVTVLGALVTLWCLADDYADENGLMRGYTPEDVDREVGINGFCRALPADWCVIAEGSIYLPDYQRHNGTTAKNAANNAERQRRFKSSKLTKAGNGPVTVGALPDKTRHRQDSEDPPLPPVGGKGTLPEAEAPPPKKAPPAGAAAPSAGSPPPLPTVDAEGNELAPPDPESPEWLAREFCGLQRRRQENPCVVSGTFAELLRLGVVTAAALAAEIRRPDRDRGETAAELRFRLVKAREKAAPGGKTMKELLAESAKRVGKA